MNRPLFVLSLALFASMLGNGVVMPFLPLYAQQFAASGAAVGMLFGAHSAARTFLLPIIGRTSDRHGRKAFLLGGMFLYAVTAIAYLLTNSLLTLVLVMAIQGIATAMIQPTSLAYVGDLTPKGKEGTYAGYANTAFLGGVAGGPVLGGVIKDLFNMQMSFIVLGVLSLLSFVLLLAFLPDSQHRKTTAKSASLPWRVIIASRPILGVTFFRLVYSLSNVMVWIFVPLLAAHLLSLNTTQVGLLISLNVLVSTLLQFPCGRLADRMSKALLIGIGGGVSALALAAFPLASNFWHLLTLNLLVGVGFGFAYPAHMALAMEHAPDSNMGTVMSMLLTVHSFAMTVVPPLFGLLVDHYTLGSAFYVAGFLSVVALVICYALINTTPGASSAGSLVEKEQTVTD
jgi:MFS family permease